MQAALQILKDKSKEKQKQCTHALSSGKLEQLNSDILEIKWAIKAIEEHGQTPFKDLNDKQICDGDILEKYDTGGILRVEGIVSFNDESGMWRINLTSDKLNDFSLPLWGELVKFAYEITGNIHDKKIIKCRDHIDIEDEQKGEVN